ncbi:MAG: PmoA family protein [Planctomycetaceae bacterium]
MPFRRATWTAAMLTCVAMAAEVRAESVEGDAAPSVAQVERPPARRSPTFAFDRREGLLEIAINGRPFASYVHRDERISRPFFANLHAPSGRRATRPHPPVDGDGLTDHATMHPGVWLSFGDISGADFWRNRARVEHVEFVEEPTGDADRASFAVRNRYLSGEKVVCTEVARYEILVRPEGYLLVWNSEFSNSEQSFAFGDQEEMGLGVRVASPLSVQSGTGRIVNAEGDRDEKGAGGKQSAWCDYSGNVEGERVGVLLMPHPENFRKSWFHARDYGFLAANPFGRNAFTRGERSRVVVKPGETFRLRFGVLIHSGREGEAFDRKAAYESYLRLTSEMPPAPPPVPMPPGVNGGA